MKNAGDMGLNAIFFQVRPSADAFYDSDYFPWSRFLTGKQGTAPSGGFDPLKYLIEIAHKRNIQVLSLIHISFVKHFVKVIRDARSLKHIAHQ